MSELRARMAGEAAAQSSFLRLLCAVSVWRTMMTRILPLCGASAWWVGIICLLPGFAAAALLRYVMHLTHTPTLTEAVRACLGKGGAIAASLMLTALLLTEGVTSITALITLFTQGLGTRGTQFTLAILTGAALLFCLHREGLPRAVHFLRWPMIAAAAAVAAFLLMDAKPDHLFPLWGEGTLSVCAAIRAGSSLAWPVTLLLTQEPIRKGRLRGGILPFGLALAAVLLLALAIPHELLTRQEELAALLLLPSRYLPNALRVAAMSLIMLAFFLAIGASAQLATTHLCAPWASVPGWLPHGLLAAMFLTQAGDPSQLWQVLGKISPWMIVPLGLLALISLPFALLRRKK